jgi:hypothetical protein
MVELIGAGTVLHLWPQLRQVRTVLDRHPIQVVSFQLANYAKKQRFKARTLCHKQPLAALRYHVRAPH